MSERSEREGGKIRKEGEREIATTSSSSRPACRNFRDTQSRRVANSRNSRAAPKGGGADGAAARELV